MWGTAQTGGHSQVTQVLGMFSCTAVRWGQQTEETTILQCHPCNLLKLYLNFPYCPHRVKILFHFQCNFFQRFLYLKGRATQKDNRGLFHGISGSMIHLLPQKAILVYTFLGMPKMAPCYSLGIISLKFSSLTGQNSLGFSHSTKRNFLDCSYILSKKNTN